MIVSLPVKSYPLQRAANDRHGDKGGGEDWYPESGNVDSCLVARSFHNRVITLCGY